MTPTTSNSVAPQPPCCPDCLSLDGYRGRVILIVGWWPVGATAPPGFPYLDGGRCHRCGAAPVWVASFRAGPDLDLVRWN